MLVKVYISCTPVYSVIAVWFIPVAHQYIASLVYAVILLHFLQFSNLIRCYCYFSYDQFLEFKFRIGESQIQSSGYDVILEGNGQSVSIRIFAQNNSAPSLTQQTYKFR